MDDNLAPSKALVFEFGYNQAKCESIEQVININKCFKQVATYLSQQQDKLNMKISTISYNEIPSGYRNSNIKIK